jgi:double zinc ribbon protein
MVRYCRRCDTEFQPHVVRCSDCGGELEDRYPDAVADVETPATEEAPGVEFTIVATNLSAGQAELVARKLRTAGIPFRVGAHGYGLVIGVRAEDRPATEKILQRARAIPRQPLPDEPAVSETGGRCPACGDPVAAGSNECPGCGLSLRGEAPTCDRCGAELDLPSEPCPRCTPGGVGG